MREKCSVEAVLYTHEKKKKRNDESANERLLMPRTRRLCPKREGFSRAIVHATAATPFHPATSFNSPYCQVALAKFVVPLDYAVSDPTVMYVSRENLAGESRSIFNRG